MQGTKQHDAQVHAEVEHLEELRMRKSQHYDATELRQSNTTQHLHSSHQFTSPPRTLTTSSTATTNIYYTLCTRNTLKISGQWLSSFQLEKKINTFLIYIS